MNNKYIKVLILGLALWYIGTLIFKADYTAKFLFKDKIWVHRVNSIQKLSEVKNAYTGIELDVVFEKKENYFDVNHPPAPSIQLSLFDYLKTQNTNPDLKYWLDFKNLQENNLSSSLHRLDSISKLLQLTKTNIIVESTRPQFLKEFQERGFLTSYYLPYNLHQSNTNDLKKRMAWIEKNLNLYETDYISANYKDYKIMRDYFPNRKKLTWLTGEPVFKNRMKNRWFMYQLLMDEKVEIMLFLVKSEKGDR